MSFIRIFAAMTVLMITVYGQASTLHVSNCTDRALCLSGCQSFDIPSDACIADNTGSQILSCGPTVDVCGDLSYYTDSTCTNLQWTQGFVCGFCALDNQDSAYSSFICDSKNGQQYLNVIGNCTSTSCGSSSCTNNWNISAGQCIPSGNGAYAKYTGATECQTINTQNWAAPGCKGKPTKRMALPQDSCMNGVRVSCNY